MENKGALKWIIFIMMFLLTLNVYAEEKIAYKNTKFNFTITYPSSWTIAEGVSGQIVSFYISPSYLGSAVQSVSVGFMNLDIPQRSLEQCESEMLTVTQMPGVELLEKGKTEIDSKESFFYLLSYNTSHMPKIKQKVYGFIAGSKLYTLDYCNETAAFDKYLSQAENIIKSFKFINYSVPPIEKIEKKESPVINAEKQEAIFFDEQELGRSEEEELLKRANDHYRKGDFFNAFELFQEFLRDYPESRSISRAKFHIADCAKEMAYVYMKEGQYRKAITYLQEYLAKSSDPEVRGKGYFEPDARAYFDMGQCYEELKDYKKAIEVYKEGVSASPRNKVVGAYMMQRIMACYEILGQDEEALFAAKRLEEDYPEEDILLDEKTGKHGYSDKIAAKEITRLKTKTFLRMLLYIGIGIIIVILSFLAVKYGIRQGKKS